MFVNFERAARLRLSHKTQCTISDGILAAYDTQENHRTYGRAFALLALSDFLLGATCLSSHWSMEERLFLKTLDGPGNLTSSKKWAHIEV